MLETSRNLEIAPPQPLMTDMHVRLAPESNSTVIPVQGEITVPGTGDYGTVVALDAPAEVARRITDTPVGPITIISEDAGLAAFTANDLARLLSARRPHDFKRVVPRKHVSYVPHRSDVVLRWSKAGCGNLHNMEKNMRTFEGELERIQALGIPLLRRNVYIVEEDKHHDHMPTTYIAVERLTRTDHLNVYNDDPDIHLDRCAAAIKYLLNTPHGRPFIEDNLYAPYQYDRHGRLFDYDPYISTNQITKAQQLRDVKNWLIQLPYPNNKTRQHLLNTINQVPWKDLGTPYAS